MSCMRSIELKGTPTASHALSSSSPVACCAGRIYRVELDYKVGVSETAGHSTRRSMEERIVVYTDLNSIV